MERLWRFSNFKLKSPLKIPLESCLESNMLGELGPARRLLSVSPESKAGLSPPSPPLLLLWPAAAKQAAARKKGNRAEEEEEEEKEEKEEEREEKEEKKKEEEEEEACWCGTRLLWAAAAAVSRPAADYGSKCALLPALCVLRSSVARQHRAKAVGQDQDSSSCCAYLFYLSR